MRASRRTVTLVVLGVVDALLVVTLVVLLVRAMPSTAPTAAPPGASGSSAATVPSTGSSIAFRLPSGNISCALSASGATCTIADFTYVPATASHCTGGAGHVVVVDATGVTTPCQVGPAPTVAADVAVLGYGTSRTVGGYTCISAQSGVQCSRGDGVGFRLARSALVVLP